MERTLSTPTWEITCSKLEMRNLTSKHVDLDATTLNENIVDKYGEFCEDWMFSVRMVAPKSDSCNISENSCKYINNKKIRCQIFKPG